MADFNIRTDAVDVEQIMHRIRTRIREKRGVDCTDDEIRELAAVKLERFLDPKAVRSDLIEQYQRRRPSVPFENYEFDDDTIYKSSRGLMGRLLTATRRLLNPLLKLFFNPGPMIEVLHRQSDINARFARRQEQVDALNFEIMNNIVVELTRLAIDVKNMKMQVESMSSRLDFDERRARALEGAVQYRPDAPRPEPKPKQAATDGAAPAEGASEPTGPKPRRRRRRGRRRSSPAAEPTAATADGAPTVVSTPGDSQEGASDSAGNMAPEGEPVHSPLGTPSTAETPSPSAVTEAAPSLTPPDVDADSGRTES